LFEVGPQFQDDTPEGQSMVAAGVRLGDAVPRNWSTPARAVDPFDAKADALAVLGEIGVPVEKLGVFPDAAPWYHPGRSGTLRLGPKTILAAFGELHPRVLTLLDCEGPCVGFEIHLDAVPAKTSKIDAPATSFLPAADVVSAAIGADKRLVAGASIFDVFAGKSVGEGMKSVAVRVTLQPIDQTLTEAEIDSVATKIVEAVTKATGATLRSA